MTSPVTEDMLEKDRVHSGQGASVPSGDADAWSATCRHAEAVADPLTDRLTKMAYGTEFLDVRADILALIERDRIRWLDNIAVCELLAKARADLAVRGEPDRPRR